MQVLIPMGFNEPLTHTCQKPTPLSMGASLHGCRCRLFWKTPGLPVVFPTNTSTNMSTKAMITLQWSLVAARMKSSCTLMPDMSLPVKVSGGFFTSTCIRKALQLFSFKSILKVNRPLPGMKILPQTFRLYLTGMQPRIRGWLLTSKPTLSIQRQGKNSLSGLSLKVCLEG